MRCSCLRHLLLVSVFCSTGIVFMGAKTPVEEADLTEINVQIGSDTWIAWCLGEVAGKKKLKKDNSLVFIPYDDLVKRYRKKKKEAKQKSLTTEIAKFGKKKKTFKNLDTAASPVCVALANDDPEQGNGDGGQGDGSGDNPQDSYFFANGDVTPLGKEVFEIPTNITANAFVGEAIFQHTCLDCHVKRSRPTMPLLRQAITPAPMSFTEDVFPDQDLADLTAYLQIGRSPLLE